jgi:hypothetical protein
MKKPINNVGVADLNVSQSGRLAVDCKVRRPSGLYISPDARSVDLDLGRLVGVVVLHSKRAAGHGNPAKVDHDGLLVLLLPRLVRALEHVRRLLFNLGLKLARVVSDGHVEGRVARVANVNVEVRLFVGVDAVRNARTAHHDAVGKVVWGARFTNI